MSQVRFLLTTISSVLKSKELDRLTICIFKMLTNISRCLKFGQKVFLGQDFFPNRIAQDLCAFDVARIWAQKKMKQFFLISVDCSSSISHSSCFDQRFDTVLIRFWFVGSTIFLKGNKRAVLLSGSSGWRPLWTSVTTKKSPNVYKSCPKMILLEKW